jgi:hypothetical protein
MKRIITVLAFIGAATAAVPSYAAEVTWQKDIKPLWDKQCSGCHGSDSPEIEVFMKDKKAWMAKGVGMRMDTYGRLISFIGWPDTGALMRRLDDGTGSKSGKPGNMYENLGDTDAERKANLKIFKAWVGNWNLKHLNEVTNKELESLKIAY